MSPTLADIARACGYVVLEAPVNRNGWEINRIELSGEGDWDALSRRVMYWLWQQYYYDHVLLILRDPQGRRRFVEFGKKGARGGELPPVKARRKNAGGTPIKKE